MGQYIDIIRMSCWYHVASIIENDVYKKCTYRNVILIILKIASEIGGKQKILENRSCKL